MKSENWFISTCVLILLMLTLSFKVSQVSGALETPQGGSGGPEYMRRPQRPAQFRREDEVRDYLEQLKIWIEGRTRNNSRYGKRGYNPKSTNQKAGHHNQPAQWTEYDYLNRYNI